jgi:hypothetical protein
MSAANGIFGFNTGLGTLVSVRESYNVTTYIDALIDPSGEGGHCNINFHNTTNDRYLFVDPTGRTSEHVVNEVQDWHDFNGTEGVGVRTYLIQSDYDEIDVNTNISLFQNAGGLSIGNLSLSTTGSMLFLPYLDGTTKLLGYNTYNVGSFTVTYNYVAHTTPEPGALALAAGSLCTGAFAVRRRRRMAGK